jgi:hypothetical protein
MDPVSQLKKKTRTQTDLYICQYIKELVVRYRLRIPVLCCFGPNEQDRIIRVENHH